MRVPVVIRQKKPLSPEPPAHISKSSHATISPATSFFATIALILSIVAESVVGRASYLLGSLVNDFRGRRLESQHLPWLSKSLGLRGLPKQFAAYWRDLAWLRASEEIMLFSGPTGSLVNPYSGCAAGSIRRARLSISIVTDVSRLSLLTTLANTKSDDDAEFALESVGTTPHET